MADIACRDFNPYLQPSKPSVDRTFALTSEHTTIHFAFTALGASTVPQGPWSQPPGQSTQQLHVRTYRRVCDPFATYHERVPIDNLARFYIIRKRMAVAHERHLDLHSCNAWVQRHRSIMLDVLQNPDSQRPDACITLVSRKRTSRPRDWRRHIPSQ